MGTSDLAVHGAQTQFLFKPWELYGEIKALSIIWQVSSFLTSFIFNPFITLKSDGRNSVVL